MSQKTYQLIQLISKVAEKMHEFVCKPSEIEGDLTISQFRVLQVLALKDRLSMAHLAELLRITPASTTVLVDKLVKQSWLVRENDPDDRRKIYIKLAPEKKEEWGRKEEIQKDRMAIFLGVLTESEQEKFIELLNKLSDQK